MVVANAEAVGGNAETGHALHEAGGQPSEAAVAQRRIRLHGTQAFEVHPAVRPAQAASARSGRRCSASPAACGREGIPATDSTPACGARRCRSRVLDSQRSTIRSRSARAAATNQSRSLAISGIPPGRIGEFLDDQATQRFDVVFMAEPGSRGNADLGSIEVRLSMQGHRVTWVATRRPMKVSDGSDKLLPRTPPFGLRH